MAIVQISRITHRKGLIENLPQLAGGEFGWAVDDRRLFIGNGTLAEGAPVVGNTEILTEYSNILGLASTYTYKGEVVNPLNPESSALPPVQTGSTPTNKVTRSLQSKLDDFASIKDFGAVGDGEVDDTDAINHALNELFCDQNNEEVRRSLFFPAGVYKVSGTIKIPSYAKIYGEGKDSTIVRYVSDDSTVDDFVVRTADSLQQVSADIGTNGATYPTSISVSDITFASTAENSILLVEKTINSTFTNVNLFGNLSSAELGDAFEGTSAIRIVSSVGIVTRYVVFDKVYTSGTTYGLYNDYNSEGIIFSNGLMNTHFKGVALGTTPVNNGPTGTRIVQTIFDRIRDNGIYIGNIDNNVSSNNIFYDVGNDFNGNGNPVSSVITINNVNNVSVGDLFQRPDADDVIEPRITLNDTGGIAFDGGKRVKLGKYERTIGLVTVLLDNKPSPTTIVHEVLDQTEITGITIDYTIKRNTSSRTGRITIAPDYGAGPTYTPVYSDDYDEYGTTGVVLSVTQASGKLYLNYTTTLTSVNGSLTYSIVKYTV